MTGFILAEADDHRQRITWFDVSDNLGRFALAIKRISGATPPEKYFCVYISVTPTEFAKLRQFEDVPCCFDISFLGIASEAVNVSTVLATKLLTVAPSHYVGTALLAHHDRIDSAADLLAAIERMRESLSHTLKKNQDDD